MLEMYTNHNMHATASPTTINITSTIITAMMVELLALSCFCPDFKTEIEIFRQKVLSSSCPYDHTEINIFKQMSFFSVCLFICLLFKTKENNLGNSNYLFTLGPQTRIEIYGVTCSYKVFLKGIC